MPGFYKTPDGRIVGPVSGAEIRQLVRDRQLGLDALISSNANGPWKRLDQVPELVVPSAGATPPQLPSSQSTGQVGTSHPSPSAPVVVPLGGRVGSVRLKSLGSYIREAGTRYPAALGVVAGVLGTLFCQVLFSSVFFAVLGGSSSPKSEGEQSLNKLGGAQNLQSQRKEPAKSVNSVTEIFDRTEECVGGTYTVSVWLDPAWMRRETKKFNDGTKILDGYCLIIKDGKRGLSTAEELGHLEVFRDSLTPVITSKELARGLQDILRRNTSYRVSASVTIVRIPYAIPSASNPSAPPQRGAYLLMDITRLEATGSDGTVAAVDGQGTAEDFSAFKAVVENPQQWSSSPQPKPNQTSQKVGTQAPPKSLEELHAQADGPPDFAEEEWAQLKKKLYFDGYLGSTVGEGGIYKYRTDPLEYVTVFRAMRGVFRDFGFSQPTANQIYNGAKAFASNFNPPESAARSIRQLGIAGKGAGVPLMSQEEYQNFDR